MGLIGREIIQSRIWVDPTAPPPPNLNYKETFPNTVFEAVYENMDIKTCKNLKQVLEEIHKELGMRQMKFPAKSANYLMTFAGTAGAVGAVEMSREIPWDPSKQRHDRIPTEKAVGDLLQKLGLLDPNGNPIDPEDIKVRWSDIIGRPLIYNELGTNDDGFMTQRAVSENIRLLKTEIANLHDNTVGSVNLAIESLKNHIANKNNPHNVTLDQIGAVSLHSFDSHVLNTDNPHQVTAAQVGLGNVNNTSDLDKPISNATQKALDDINKALFDLIDDASDFIKDISYDITTGDLTATYVDGDTKVLNIPINGLVDEISYDINTKDLVIIELSGEEKRVSLSDLFIRYKGSVSKNITVVIGDGTGGSGSFVPKDGMIELETDEISTIWDRNILPADSEDDTASIGISQISEPETNDMWDYGTMPDESGPEQIQRESLTQQEIEDMWINGIFPVETPDELVPGDGSSDVNVTGWQVISATINELSITENEMANNAVVTRVIKNKAVTTEKIDDKAVTSDKLDDGAVTTDNIANYSVTNRKLGDRSVDGRTLFTSIRNNRVLGVIENGTDPAWVQIVADMIDYNAIENRHILKAAVTADKLAENSVITSKIENDAITTEKIKNYAVTHEKIMRKAINGDNLDDNIVIPGTPSISRRPTYNDNGTSIPDTHWVNERLDNNVFESKNYGPRSVDGKALFSSPIRHRALVVLRADSDPVWGQITTEMLGINSVATDNISDYAVTSDKIKEKSIERKHLVPSLISENYLDESSVTSEKIFTYHTAYRVLATLSDYGHPVYTQVTRQMIENGAISSMQIEDQSVTPSKIKPSEDPHMLLGVALSNTNPQWMKLTSGMIGNRVILGKHVFTTPYDNMILGVTVANTDPQWMKIIAPMIGEGAVRREHIGNGEIWQEHLQEKIIESRHIMDWSIKSNNIAPRAISGTELFTSPYPNRVLAINDTPYTDPQWLQINTDMIEDKAVTKDKIFTALNDYEVLGSTRKGAPPEYLKITNEFICDDTILPNKLVRNFVLYGTPELTIPPKDDANNYQLANTMWVRQTIKSMVKDFNLLVDIIDSNMIKESSITGDKFFRSIYDGPRVLGVTAKGEEVEYLRIEEDMIVDGSITTNKIQRDIHLLGSPIVEVRPSPYADDNHGGGQLIPDCQWVLDRIADAIGSSGSGGSSSGGGTSSGIVGDVLDGSISTVKLMDRAVTAKKLFTSTASNMILGVLGSNTDPQYLKINNDMLSDRIVDSRVLFTSNTDDMILAVSTSGTDPIWSKINHNMLEDNIISTDNIMDYSITRDKLANGIITREKLANIPIIDNILIMDNSITTPKIVDNAIETSKILDESVTSPKLEKDLVLKGHPTVEPDTDFETRSIRNTIISPNNPTGGCSGDIWFRFI